MTKLTGRHLQRGAGMRYDRYTQSRPTRPSWTDDPVADAEAWYEYLEECENYDEEAEDRYIDLLIDQKMDRERGLD